VFPSTGLAGKARAWMTFRARSLRGADAGEALVLNLLCRTFPFAQLLCALALTSSKTCAIFLRSRFGFGAAALFAVLVEVDDHGVWDLHSLEMAAGYRAGLNHLWPRRNRALRSANGPLRHLRQDVILGAIRKAGRLLDERDG
jgi:hypothetical protein